MNIIISGGLGYVGGRLSKYLAEQGHTVVALSRQANTLPPIIIPRGLSVMHPDHFTKSSKQLKGFDAFIHLAALNENDCITFPEKAIDINIVQTLQWLDRAYQAGIKQFVYFSTAHVYGKPLQGYYDEQSLTRPVHPYAISHKCAEDYVLSYREKGMNNIVIRLTNSFGGPAFPTANRWTLLINDLCHSAVKTKTMNLQSDGMQLRDFVCMEDVSSATLHLMLINPNEHQTIFNLSRGASMSVWEMALLVKERAEDFLQHSIDLNRKKSSQNLNGSSLEISNQKLVKTGFTFTGKMNEEIISTLKYFKSNNV